MEFEIEEGKSVLIIGSIVVAVLEVSRGLAKLSIDGLEDFSVHPCDNGGRSTEDGPVGVVSEPCP